MTGSSAALEGMDEPLKFGTSGLRGLARVLDGAPAFAYASAFASMLLARGEVGAGTPALIGRDLRPSSRSITARVAAGLKRLGLRPIDCGELPTPALALHALELSIPAIMVTGSHIPEDRNGLKFYRASGEIDKRDELAIAQAVQEGGDTGDNSGEPIEADAGAMDGYLARYRSLLKHRPLQGLRIGVYQHSSLSRDLLVTLLAEGGAEVIALGRSERFVPVDTEAVRPEDHALALGWSQDHGLDAVVSTDGDGDRPLVFDEKGRFIRGDLLGAVTAHALAAGLVVTPVTSNSGIERSGRFAHVRRTRIGSPYVIEAMERARQKGVVVGFEANGGVMLGTMASLFGGSLTPLPTRDALLPILACLLAAQQQGITLGALGESFGFSAAASGRLEHVPPDRSALLLRRLKEEGDFRAEALGGDADAMRVDETDGVRLIGRDAVIHFRASGNAPELRCYVEGPDEARARRMLEQGLEFARLHLRRDAAE